MDGAGIYYRLNVYRELRVIFKSLFGWVMTEMVDEIGVWGVCNRRDLPNTQG